MNPYAPEPRSQTKSKRRPASPEKSMEVSALSGNSELVSASEELPAVQSTVIQASAGAAQSQEPWSHVDVATLLDAVGADQRSLPESALAGDVAPGGERIPLAYLGIAIAGCARVRSRAAKTGRIYVEWARRFVLFHGRRHPSDMGIDEVSAFIRDLVERKKVSAATQNQALQALIFLYAKVLNAPLPMQSLRAVRPKRVQVLPEVLSRQQITEFFNHIVGVPRLVAWFQYGCGMKLLEVLRLRLSAINLDKQRVKVRAGHRRVRTLRIPTIMMEPLAACMRECQQQWQLDQQRLLTENKTMKDVDEQVRFTPSPYLFPSHRARRDPRSGIIKRHHIDERFIQDHYRVAFQAAGISTATGAVVLRHSYAVHVLEKGGDICVVQEALGHKDIRTTMLYVQVSNVGPAQVRSPADELPKWDVPRRVTECAVAYDVA